VDRAVRVRLASAWAPVLPPVPVGWSAMPQHGRYARVSELVMDNDRLVRETAVMFWWEPVLGLFALLLVMGFISDRRNRRRGVKLSDWRVTWAAIREDRRDLRAYRSIKNVHGPGTDWMARRRR